QAEAPLIALCRFSKPALGVRAGRDASGQLHRAIVLQKFASPSSGGDNDEATSRPRSEPGRVLTPRSADKMLIEEREDRKIKRGNYKLPSCSDAGLNSRNLIRSSGIKNFRPSI